MATDWSLSEICSAPCSENTARIKWCKFTFLQNHLNVQMCELKYLFGSLKDRLGNVWRSPSKHQVLSPQAQLEEARPAGRVPGSGRHKRNRKMSSGHLENSWFWSLQTRLEMSPGLPKNTRFCHHKHSQRRPDFLCKIPTNTTGNSPRSP